jgi:hypothetical protein
MPKVEMFINYEVNRVSRFLLNKLNAIVIVSIILLFSLNLNTLASINSVKTNLMNGNFTSKNSQQFATSIEQLTETVLSVFKDCKISIYEQQKEQDQTVIFGGRSVSAWSWG